jgi:hypothetical protein
MLTIELGRVTGESGSFYTVNWSTNLFEGQFLLGAGGATRLPRSLTEGSERNEPRRLGNGLGSAIRAVRIWR